VRQKPGVHDRRLNGTVWSRRCNHGEMMVLGADEV